ncbi:hypothetical protein L1049_015459 [Liquidambar formosana]|uniref:Protein DETOXIFICATION n=1 Tax=Liquidambar formosana TaxID=63359 RepID=A0AAP0X6J7_LIQFO
MEEKPGDMMQLRSGLLGRQKIEEKGWIDESKKMWSIAGPASLAQVVEFSIGFVTLAFVGHLGEVELAAVSLVQTLVEGLVYGFMLGMGSALETLCGQAVGTRHFNMLGIYLQRSLIITGATACLLIPIYVFTSPLLKLLKQNENISELAGEYSKWVIPQLFAYAINFPIQFLLQAQSKIWVMTTISKVALLGDMVLQCSDPHSGLVKESRIAVDSISICMNLELWTLTISVGFFAAVSVRVSNELGAGNPEAAKFSVEVAIITSILFGILFSCVILATQRDFPKLFSQNPQVIKETSKMGYFLAATIVVSSIQPVHGMAVGAGWRFLVALISTGCYYIFGLPIGASLCYKFNVGVRGIWSGVLAGCLLQTISLLFIMLRTDWRKEESILNFIH